MGDCGLISFSSFATHICNPGWDISDVRDHLPGLVSGGSTKIAEGIQLATENLKGKPGPLAMVVITDCMPDDVQAALTAAQDAKRSGIDVTTVGTEDADQRTLQKLASRSDLAVVVKRELLGKGIASAAKMLPGKEGSLEGS